VVLRRGDCGSWLIRALGRVDFKGTGREFYRTDEKPRPLGRGGGQTEGHIEVTYTSLGGQEKSVIIFKPKN